MDPFSEIQKMQDELLASNEWLRKKVNPAIRLADHRVYFQKNFPELGSGLPQRRFLDIGCGPGESLQVAAENGHLGLGIETPVGDGGMGNDYVAYGIRRHILEGLSVLYGRATEVIRRLPAYSFDCVNMRGSFEQCFSHCMDGRPHHEHHKASEMTWRISDCRVELFRFARYLVATMSPGAKLVIHANGSVNHDTIRGVVRSEFREAGIEGDWVESHLYHGWSA